MPSYTDRPKTKTNFGRSLTRIRKQVFCGQLVRGKRLPAGRRKRYKDGLKQNLKTCGISLNELNSAPLARASWPSRCQDAIDDFEATRVGAIQTNGKARKTTIRTTGQWTCDRCGRICESRFGLTESTSDDETRR